MDGRFLRRGTGGGVVGSVGTGGIIGLTISLAVVVLLVSLVCYCLYSNGANQDGDGKDSNQSRSFEGDSRTSSHSYNRRLSPVQEQKKQILSTRISRSSGQRGRAERRPSQEPSGSRSRRRSSRSHGSRDRRPSSDRVAPFDREPSFSSRSSRGEDQSRVSTLSSVGSSRGQRRRGQSNSRDYHRSRSPSHHRNQPQRHRSTSPRYSQRSNVSDYDPRPRSRSRGPKR